MIFTRTTFYIYSLNTLSSDIFYKWWYDFLSACVQLRTGFVIAFSCLFLFIFFLETRYNIQNNALCFHDMENASWLICCSMDHLGRVFHIMEAQYCLREGFFISWKLSVYFSLYNKWASSKENMLSLCVKRRSLIQPAMIRKLTWILNIYMID